MSGKRRALLIWSGTWQNGCQISLFFYSANLHAALICLSLPDRRPLRWQMCKLEPLWAVKCNLTSAHPEHFYTCFHLLYFYHLPAVLVRGSPYLWPLSFYMSMMCLFTELCVSVRVIISPCRWKSVTAPQCTGPGGGVQFWVQVLFIAF